MEINEKKLNAIMSLPGPKRYSHFIKVAADQRKVWGLFDDGWALVQTDQGQRAFPIWPAADYARQFAVDEWKTYAPKEIDLDTLLDVLIPKLRESGDLVAVFPTPNQKGVFPSLGVLSTDLRQELTRIE
jgi:Protein of unknown function (DUF2750)